MLVTIGALRVLRSIDACHYFGFKGSTLDYRDYRWVWLRSHLSVSSV